MMSGHFFGIAVVHLVMSGFSLLVWSGLALLSCGVAGAAATDDPAGGLIAGGLFSALLAGWLVIGILPGLLAGYLMLSRRPLGRILAIVLGVLALPGFPLLTAFGAWSLWALLSEEGAREYADGLRN